ncbi:hypothetical protein [Parapedobacter sp. 10938]|uniref:hypothetical protein n=1 Tax=Parapedobacter flavus TaxID=3110225 RepID=UPI002DBB4ACB|nr:hypothetical protein [Parapedobacter sp. 10938]
MDSNDILQGNWISVHPLAEHLADDVSPSHLSGRGDYYHTCTQNDNLGHNPLRNTLQYAVFGLHYGR